jgi:hypothetical protein
MFLQGFAMAYGVKGLLILYSLFFVAFFISVRYVVETSVFEVLGNLVGDAGN